MGTPGRMLRAAGRLCGALLALIVLGALLVGVPWGLWRYFGWPLPTQLPTLAELEAFLLAPLPVSALLDLLACLAWPLWLFFAVDVARCMLDALRGVRVPALGPVHALAAFLVTAGILGLLGPRSPITPPTSSPPIAIVVDPPVPIAVHSELDLPVRHEPAGAVLAAGTVVVRAPENGVHDSLWRIAGRMLGDATRWPEIFEANRDKPQPNGATLTNPDLIFPGEQLTLPPAAAPTPPATSTDPDATLPGASAPEAPLPPPPPSTTATPGPATSSSPPVAGQPVTPAPTATPVPTAVPAPITTPASPVLPAPPARPGSGGEPGIAVGPGVFVGLGLATAVSAALLIARRRYRRRYRPGSGDRDDLPVAPVVYQLRLAHLRADQDKEIDLAEDHDDGERPERVPPLAALVVGAPQSRASDLSALTPGLGVRDGREIALDLAGTRGLGLVGAGASAAARALLVAVLTASADKGAAVAQPAGTAVVVPAEDLVGVLGRGAAHARLPTALRVVAALDDALDALEAEMLVRATASCEQSTAPGSWPALVLVARPPEHQHQRLQAVLDNGAPFGITGLLLGQWQPGVTAYVREDGTISATSPGLGEALRGTRTFRLGNDDTAELLTLLQHAEPDAPAVGEVPVCDTELDVTAASEAPVPADTELEITGLHAVPAPGTRRRPRPTDRKPPAPSSRTVSTPNDSRTTTTANNSQTDSAAPAIAKKVESSVPTAVPVRMTVLGPPRVFWRPGPDPAGAEGTEREITGAFQPRTRELLVFLALHPGGASREALVAALWADNPPEKTTNAMNTALSRLRRSVSKATDGALADIAVVGGGRYRLNPVLVDVDYWRFAAAVAARRAAAAEQQRIDAYREVIDGYGGPLADGMSTEWIETTREAIRRDAIDAVAALARALVEDDPQQTLDLLEVARAFDPHNEALYRDIMRLQERLGQLDAIPRTLTLLTTRLAEIDDRPTEQAIRLAARLLHRHDDSPVAQPMPATRGGHGRSAAS